ncbi:hypothetical protein B0A49_13457 [Cryomyces minteri]|uniref:Enoyl reductase (ER) domain-containing protein n=1 Tax=Cryomyces minteri TaxID=331657 RepID=A0A4U0X0T8_9PEZI|nr:hypothetical protein B0A49_13457 [Cryomyces minteri]
MAGNQAAWLDGKGEKLRVGPAEMPKPGPDEVVIRNHAIAVNPVDWKVQDYGVMVQRWPTLMGGDIAGEIVEVGTDVKNLKKGDRVMAHVASLLTQKTQEAGFQLYTCAPAATTAVVPGSISYADASVLPLCFDTAVVGMCSEKERGYLGLPFPSLNPKPCSKVIVVWGGSSAVGANVIQLSVAAGAKVIATASSHNFDFCKGCGASEVFDYKSSSIADEVAKAVKSAGGEFAGVYDAISILDQSMKPCFDILEKLGGGNMAVVLPPPEDKPSGVTIGQVLGWSPLTHGLWKSYITQALEEGKLKCMPPAVIIGKGLEAIQNGLDENKKGVSAKKVVIEL